MDEKRKKLIVIGVAAFEALFLIFALVISIIVFTTITDGEGMTEEAWRQANITNNGEFIGFLQNESTAFFCIFIIPTLVFIVVDFIYFAVIASKKESSLSDAELAAIKKQAEEEVRAEMLAQMKAEIKAEAEEKEQPEEK